jgi:hypothetical protein
MSSPLDVHAEIGDDRRKNLKGRVIFDEVVERLRPFVGDNQGWNGSPLELWASHMLRETYPDLAPHEIHSLVVAAIQVCRGRDKPV